MRKFHLAIDGPAGSGKSTISSKIAKQLKWTHIDTGAMYRAVTLAALQKNVDLNDEKSYLFLETTKIQYENEAIILNGQDVSKEIRDTVVTRNVSLVSSFPYVRKKLVDLQRAATFGLNIVMDGRDIGTAVLPNATLKIFLTAHVEERAKRRYQENIEAGKITSMDEVINDIIARDDFDSKRKESPLTKAKDAILIDTTYLTIDEVVEKILVLIAQRRSE